MSAHEEAVREEQSRARGRRSASRRAALIGRVRSTGLPARVLAPVRRHGRPVVWTPPFMGFGNILLLVQWAYRETATSGRHTWCLTTPALGRWPTVMPGLRAHLLPRAQVRFADRRLMPWRGRSAPGGDGRFDDPDLDLLARFLDDVVLPGSPATDPAFLDVDPDRLVVNVRRGDYYSDPTIRNTYGFDVESYLRSAVAASVHADGAPSAIRIVSDGPDWCRARLGWLSEVAPVEFTDPAADEVRDFYTVAAARRAIITNSTFSYWAAHVGNAVRGDNHAQVWAPRFFDRSRNGGRSWLLDPRWSVVEQRLDAVDPGEGWSG